MFSAVTPAVGVAAATGVIERRRSAGHGPGGGGRELRPRPFAQIALADGAEDLVSDRVALDALPHRLDGSGGVHAGNQREPMLHVVLQVALHHRGVERIHPGDGDPQPDLTFRGIRHREITNRALLSESIQRERLHLMTPIVGGSPGNPATRSGIFPKSAGLRTKFPDPLPEPREMLRVVFGTRTS